MRSCKRSRRGHDPQCSLKVSGTAPLLPPSGLRCEYAAALACAGGSLEMEKRARNSQGTRQCQQCCHLRGTGASEALNATAVQTA